MLLGNVGLREVSGNGKQQFSGLQMQSLSICKSVLYNYRTAVQSMFPM